MEIKRKGVKIQLKKTTPSELTVEKLKKQLNGIGLTCKHTEMEKLKIYKEEVLQKLPNGQLQTYGIYKLKDTSDREGELAFYDARLSDYEISSNGNWEPSDSAMGYSSELSYVIYPTHFDYLKQYRPSFTGIISEPPLYSGKYETVDAIMNLFTEVGTNVSASLINGLNKSSLESILSNAISPLKDATLTNYDKEDSRLIFLVEDYDEEKDDAKAIGVLSIYWHLKIKDYTKKKESTKHDTTLKIIARSVLYDDINVLFADKAFVETHFKDNLFLLSIPPRPQKLIIYDSKPAPSAEVFYNGLPLISKINYVDVIILHSANLEEIDCFDNTESEVSTRFSKSVTSGFTFSTSQTLSTESSFEVSIEFVKAGFKIGFQISFTETWNKSQTETIEYSIPARKKVFIYQGYLMASLLRYNPENDTYKYVDNGRFLTNIYKTTDKPII